MTATTDIRPCRILLLEDEPMILMDLRFCLEDAGFEPVTARSCDSALAKLDQSPPDAALLDVNLGGGETCEEVADRLREMQIPFALHTGDLDRQGELVQRFSVPILSKPCASDDIVAQIRRLCEQPVPG